MDEVVTSPWAFSTFDLNTVCFRDRHSVLEYGNSPTKFERITGFIQDSIDLSMRVVLSLGAKFEDSDLSGSSIQPGS